MAEGVEHRSLAAFSDFLDELEELAVDVVNQCELNEQHTERKRPLASSSADSNSFLKSWIGTGLHGAEMEARREEASLRAANGDEVTLELCMDESEDRDMILDVCVSLRHNTLSHVCATLIPHMPLVIRSPSPADPQLARGWDHILTRLAASQTTRERWLYPLRRALPSGPEFILQHMVHVFHHALRADVVSSAAAQLADIEALLDSATYEIALSPSLVLKRFFPLFEGLVEMTVGLAYVRVHTRVWARDHQTFEKHNIVVEEHAHNDAGHSTIVDDAVVTLENLKKRFSFLFRVVGGSEIHWCFMSAFVERLIAQESASLTQPLAPSVVVTKAVWVEVLQSLRMWLSSSPSIHLSALSQQSSLSAVHASRIFERDRLCFLPIASRQNVVRSMETMLLRQVPELRTKLLHVDCISHMSVVPFYARLCHDEAEDNHCSPVDAATSTLLRKVQALLLPRNRQPRMPEWLHPDGVTRGLSCLDRIGWGSRAFGSNAEFHSLHAQSGRITAEHIVELHACTLSAAPYHLEAFQKLFAELPLLRKYLCSLAIRSPTVCEQLDDHQKARYLAAIIPLVLGDPTLTPSTNIFAVEPYDVLREFITNVMPLAWDVESIKRLHVFVKEHIVTAANMAADVECEDEQTRTRSDGSDVLRMKLTRAERFCTVAMVVFVAVADCVVDGLISARTAFESRSGDEQYEGAMCFSSEDAAIFEAYVHTVHELLPLEFAVRDSLERIAEVPTSQQSSRSGPVAPDPHDSFPAKRTAMFDESLSSTLLHETHQHPPLSSRPQHSTTWWSEGNADWSVATVSLPSASPTYMPPQPSERTAPGMPPVAASGTPLDSSFTNRLGEYRVGVDARLLPLYLAWLQWVLSDLLVQPRHGDEKAPILSNDASMHLSVGLRIGECLVKLIQRQPWTVGTLRTVCVFLKGLLSTEVAGRKVGTPSTGAVGDPNESQRCYSIPVSSLTRIGLTRTIFGGELSISRAQLDAELLRVFMSDEGSTKAVADAMGNEKTRLVSDFLDSWRLFCELFGS